ncbi:MAG: hypothetical protein ACYSX0_17245 [Planctomycetota bacterium]
MFSWEQLKVLCLGGAGQTGKEICRRLARKGADTVIVHDLELARSEEALKQIGDTGRTKLVASGGNLFHPSNVGTWKIGTVCREVPGSGEEDTDFLQSLIDARLMAFTPDVVRRSLIWNLVSTYRPHVVVDSINTATVLGYRSDLIHSGREIARLNRKLLDALRHGSEKPLRLEELHERVAAESSEEITRDLVEIWKTSLHMTAYLDVAGIVRFVQCLHALFCGEEGLRVPEFQRYVKVHTTGLGGMGFNIQYTHGDTGEPGLSTKLLGKVYATGSLTQLLQSLAHTPGCDVRVVVPATLVGWEDPADYVVRSEIQDWESEPPRFERGALPLVDSEVLVPCDGSVTLREALKDSPNRVSATGAKFEVPHLCSGENNPYATEDIQAITALGQMGCITKEEVARAAMECIEGESRYDAIAAIDASLLLPTQTAAVERDRHLATCHAKEGGHSVPSVSLGNLGPTTAKLLYEIEILRACFETVERIANEPTEMEMTLGACSYILEDEAGAILRRQILSLGLPIFLRKGPGQAGLLLGNRILFPDAHDPVSLQRKLDPEDEKMKVWLASGWIDLTGPRMAWWKQRFQIVLEALDGERAVSRNWFDPRQPFRAGPFLGYLHSVTGGQRKQYM